MITFIIFLTLLACLFIFFYGIERIHRKRYQDWYQEAQFDHLKSLEDKLKMIDEFEKNFHEMKKLLLKDMKKRQDLYQNFTEWIEGLETQTLTDELKEEIIRNANFNMD